MAEPDPPILQARQAQMYPVLEANELARLERFGERRRFADGEYLARVGEPSFGLALLLSGQVAISHLGADQSRTFIASHAPGGFLGELAQLSGRPSLVDAIAQGPVEAVVIAPDRLRSLLVEEAELGERIMRALILRRVGLIERNAGPVILGRAGDPNVVRLDGFLTRNGHPHQRLDPAEDPAAAEMLERFDVAPADLPIVLCPNGEMLRNPTENQLGRCLGLVAPIDPARVYDLVIVGAGPAGLAASVYAASEGLSVLVLDCRAFGGQAGASSRIENYLGFPTGISGMALMARAFSQAQKFGVEMAIPDQVTALERSEAGVFTLTLQNGETVRSRSVVVAAGVSYRRLAVPNLEAFEGSAVHYWASPVEARLCSSQPVVLVGGGNSAGQAVVFLAGQASKVSVLVRAPGLESSMSRYLIERLAALPNVELVTRASVTALEGEDGALSNVRWRNLDTGEDAVIAAHHLFSFIGADPHTGWLGSAGVRCDAKGFILTGAAADAPHPLASSVPGLFAIGDVRSGSIKRVAAAVGEGAQVVAAIHGWLADHALIEPGPAQPADPDDGHIQGRAPAT